MFTLACLFLAGILAAAHGHETHTGACPRFTPVTGFDWERFKGTWYAVEKFGTEHSKCWTYTFGEDDDGFPEVKQRAVNTLASRLGADHDIIYPGKLTTPRRTEPGAMIVRFLLNPVGTSSFVVLDTDYDRYALVCGCQATDLFVFTLHRRTCTILQRDQVRDPDISAQLRRLVNEQVLEQTGDEDASHDFDIIDQRNCNHGQAKFNVDVGKIVELGQGQLQRRRSNNFDLSHNGPEYGDFNGDDVELI